MPAATNLYEILGAPRHATQEAIRRQYRLLVRQYHPDVHVDKLEAHHRFIEIIDAYKTLSDPARRKSYDRAFFGADVTERGRASQYSWEEEVRRRSIDALLTAAEVYFLRGKVAEALAQCRRVIKEQPTNAFAFSLLGDMYKELRRFDEAATMYTMAAQYAPDKEVFQQKLENLAEKEKGESENNEVSERASTRRVMTWRDVAWGAAAFVVVGLSLLWLRSNPGRLVVGDLPLHALVVGPLDAFLVGVLMAARHWLQPFEDEFFSASLLSGSSEITPAGMLIGVAGMVWFYLAILFYVVIAVLNEHWSVSLLKVFAVSAILMIAMATACSDARNVIFLVGGNVLFTLMMLGWLAGSWRKSDWL